MWRNLPEIHPKENDQLTFTFVTDGIESTVRQARAAAGDKDVQVIGSAKTLQEFIQKRLFDELQVDIIPIFLNEGLRPFDGVDTEDITLERTKVIELPGGRTHLRFRLVQ